MTEFGTYLRDVEPLAYEAGLRPWEFWRMTPAELAAFLEGHKRREERALERAAWMMAHHYNMHIPRGKPRPSIDKLLGRKKNRPSWA